MGMNGFSPHRWQGLAQGKIWAADHTEAGELLNYWDWEILSRKW